MMLLVPFLIAIIPGIIILLLTWWFTKKGLPLFGKLLPGSLALIASVVLFYVGFVSIRGFEGGAYGILSIILFIFSVLSFIFVKRDTRDAGKMNL